MKFKMVTDMRKKNKIMSSYVPYVGIKEKNHLSDYTKGK